MALAAIERNLVATQDAACESDDWAVVISLPLNADVPSQCRASSPFWRSGLSLRFIRFAILASAAFECCLSNLMSTAVYGLRIVFLALRAFLHLENANCLRAAGATCKSGALDAQRRRVGPRNVRPPRAGGKGTIIVSGHHLFILRWWVGHQS